MALTREETSELSGMLDILEDQATTRRRFTWVGVVGGVILAALGVQLLLLTGNFPLLASMVEADTMISKAGVYIIVYDVLLEVGVLGVGMFAATYGVVLALKSVIRRQNDRRMLLLVKLARSAIPRRQE
ncbi:MAG: hypothetical protein ACLFV7_12610 [Phycisphaerae bacterium]